MHWYSTSSLYRTTRLKQGLFSNIYDANAGMFVFKALYNSQQQQLSNNNPRHVVVNGLLKDVPVMRDFLGFVPEARQMIECLDLTTLPGDIPLPACLVDIVEPSIAPLKFSPGPQEGYYTIYMDPNRRTDFEFRREEENPVEE